MLMLMMMISRTAIAVIIVEGGVKEVVLQK